LVSVGVYRGYRCSWARGIVVHKRYGRVVEGYPELGKEEEERQEERGGIIGF
jgi:hypothetical protein